MKIEMVHVKVRDVFDGYVVIIIGLRSCPHSGQM